MENRIPSIVMPGVQELARCLEASGDSLQTALHYAKVSQCALDDAAVHSAVSRIKDVAFALESIPLQMELGRVPRTAYAELESLAETSTLFRR